MNIDMMHIGIDLGIQRLNSNVFGELLPEAKDYFINTVTQEFVKLALTDEKNTIFTPQTYADIRKYYEILQVYIRSIELGINDELGEGYVYGNLPTSISNDSINSGQLYNGIKYKVLVKGSIQLLGFGGPLNPSDGDEFICDISEQGGTTITIKTDEYYRIINPAGANFKPFGAKNNNPGTEFIGISDGTVTGTTAGTMLKNLSKFPDWQGATLLPLTNKGYYMNISSRSAVKKGMPITNGILKKGKVYIAAVDCNGDFSGCGELNGHISKGYILKPISDCTPTWSSGDMLYEIDRPTNRLIKYQDIGSFTRNGFGSVSSSPISVIADNKLKVYYNTSNNPFDIERIYLDYIKKPVEVDKSKGINSDLPDSVHPFLIDLVIEKIAALSGNPVYNAIDKENKENE